ncbi:hypothetical protein [Nevskia ramosa]|uniref:hypothetical protein n=1 Tax=Nevskia ramosa TaxID=64002 RepID=UPI0012EC9DF9|nr:hypothetical protein [Nevskia ramosa]
MSEDVIREVGIDNEGRLYVRPSQQRFPYIYREAMEVSWHESSGTLSAPVPREWSHARWFQQIHTAAKQQGCFLTLSPGTEWHSVPESTHQEICAYVGSVHAQPRAPADGLRPPLS